MGFNDVCNTGLVLGLGFSATSQESIISPSKPKKLPNCVSFEPYLTLSLSGQVVIPNRNIIINNTNNNNNNNNIDVKKVSELEFPNSDLHRQASPHSAVSNSFSSGRVKREREVSSTEEIEVEKVSSRVSDEDEDGVNARKKLRLTKDQSALLEESFKIHSTLNPKQKQALARQLNLRPRQVEVWFQNRRARTKLKQTEVDCEFLKKCCETLTDENRRLQKEVQELKALKFTQPFYMHMPAATLTMCPSCERIGSGGVGETTTASTKSPFSMAPNSHFYKSFTNPSAAC